MNGEEAYFLSRAYTDKNSVDPTNYYDKATTDTLLSDKADASTTYTKTETDNLLKNKVDWESNGVLGAKNLLPYDLSSLKAVNTAGTWSSNVYSYLGIDYTVNDDLSISMSGTSTGTIRFFLCNYDFVSNREYIMSTGNSSATTTTPGYYIQIFNSGLSIDIKAASIEKEITFTNNTTATTRIIVESGAVLTNETFYPMLRLATDTDTTYQPYAMTNRELTVNKVDKTNLAIEQGPVTLNSGLFSSGSFVNYQKYGKIVILTFDLRPDPSPIDATSNFVDIITGNLPYTPAYGTGSSFVSSTTTTTGYVATIRVTNLKNMSIYMPASTWTSSYFIRGQMTYVTSD